MKPTQKQINDYMNMLNDTLGSFTLLDLVREMKGELSTRLMDKTEQNIAEYAKTTGIECKKVRQNQGKHAVIVNSYPVSSKRIIKEQTFRFLDSECTRVSMDDLTKNCVIVGRDSPDIQ